MSDESRQIDMELGKKAAIVLHAAEESYFRSRRDELLKKGFDGLRDGNLTPEMAMQILIQLHEHSRVLKDLRKLVKAGEQAVAKISSSMEHP